MRLLGAVLAGGKARRFGSDKAVALLKDRPLIEHVIARLRPQVADLVVIGRSWGDLQSLGDRPSADMGPLGGLNAALHHAAAEGFDAVLTSGCDLPDLPLDLAKRLAPGPAVVAGQPLLGLWPAHLAPALDLWLATTEDLSMAAWLRQANGREIALSRPVANINRPEELDAFSRSADPRSSR